MISVIICSINPIYAEQISANIAATIGVPYELLIVDNRGTSDGIGTVYNRAAAQAKHPYLCFVHEDVVLHTQNWGEILVQVLSQNNIGLVGVAGAVYKSKYPAVWSACDAQLYRANGLQHFKHLTAPVSVCHNPLNETISEVAVVDGVFLAVSKTTFQQCPFNNTLLQGFHGYDLDFALQVQQIGKKVVVVYQIIVEHFSEGSLSQSWLNTYQLLHKKWATYLPLKIGAIDQQLKAKADYLAIQTVLKVALATKGNKQVVIYYFFLAVVKYGKWNRGLFLKSVLRYVCS